MSLRGRFANGVLIILVVATVVGPMAMGEILSFQKRRIEGQARLTTLSRISYNLLFLEAVVEHIEMETIEGTSLLSASRRAYIRSLLVQKQHSLDFVLSKKSYLTSSQRTAFESIRNGFPAIFPKELPFPRGSMVVFRLGRLVREIHLLALSLQNSEVSLEKKNLEILEWEYRISLGLALLFFVITLAVLVFFFLRFQRISAINEDILRKLIEDLSLQEDLPAMVAQGLLAAERLAEADGSGVALLDSKGQCLAYRFKSGILADIASRESSQPFSLQEIGADFFGSGEGRLITDFGKDRKGLSWIWERGVRSAAIVPVVAGPSPGEPLGILTIVSTNPRRLIDKRILPLLTAVAHQVGIGLHREALLSEIRTQKDRLQDVFDHLPDIIYTVIFPQLAPVYVSPSSTQVLGYTPEELIANPGLWKSLVIGDGLLQIQEAIDRILREGGTAFCAEFSFRHRDGREVAFLGHGTIERSSAGIPLEFHGILMNVTDRKKAEEGLKIASAVFDATSEGILVVDGDDRIVSVNPAFSRVTGFASKDVLGKNVRILASERTGPEIYREMKSALDAGVQWEGELWSRKKDGESYLVRLSVSAISSKEGVRFRVGVFSDITLKKGEEEKIRYLATHDPLTGLPNRTILKDRLDRLLAVRDKNALSAAVLFLDLDRFKPINDTLGHSAGDEVLVEVGRRLLHSVRQEDTVSRQGGDEFIILLSEVRSREDAERISEKIVGEIAKPFLVHGHSLSLDVSVGISFYPESGRTSEEILKNADLAMYRAKKEGRCRASGPPPDPPG